MAVIMITELPGFDAGFADAARTAGIVDAMSTAPGFQGHLSGATDSGYRVVEVWESREAHQAWYASQIAPNLPPGVEPTTPQYIEVALRVPER